MSDRLDAAAVIARRNRAVRWRRRGAALLLAAPLFALVSAAGDERLAESAEAALVRTRLRALLAPRPAATRVGLLVVDALTGEIWFAQQPDLPLKPASVMKLFVTAAAIEHLGADFRFETSVHARDSELWIIGGGDPALGDERLAERNGQPRTEFYDAVARALLARGIRSIDKIVLDDSVFDRNWRHDDWPNSEATAWYQAPVGGLNFNDNCLDSRIELRDGRVRLILQPDLPRSFVRDRLVRGPKHAPRVDRRGDGDVFEFQGTVARSAAIGPVAVRRPTLFFGHALRVALEARGIEVRGEIVRRKIANEALRAEPPIVIRATPLEDLLWRCNTFSQNLFAECLIKALAAYADDGTRLPVSGTWERGAAVLRSTLEAMGIDVDHAVFRDGSGLSHHNRVTARQVVTLLSVMRRHASADLFVNSLAAPGQPGTLRRRYDEPELRDRMRGKTGTLRGVRALAGYISRPDGTQLAFALLINGTSESALPLRVCKILVGAAPAAAPALHSHAAP